MGPAKKSVRVLVVDDDPTMRSLVRRAAQQMRMDVWIAASVREAQQLLLEGNRPDLVVTDLMLGDGRGTEIIEFMRRTNLPAPAILVTASAENLDPAERGYFVDVVHKPFRLSVLFDALEVARRNVRPRHRSNVHRKARESAISIPKASGEDER